MAQSHVSDGLVNTAYQNHAQYIGDLYCTPVNPDGTLRPQAMIKELFGLAGGTAGVPYIFDIGLTEGPPGTVNLDPASALVIGGIMEPTADGNWMRTAAGGVYGWAPITAGAALTFDTGLTLTGTSVNLDPALPAPGEIGGINEPPADTGFQYTRSYTAGVGIWTQTAAGTTYTWGIGLDEVPPASGNIDLIPATPTVIGGVSVPARSLVQGLVLAASGALTAPPATDLLAGSIVEPLPDGLTYGRSRSTAGVSGWVPVTAGAFVGDAPPAAPNTQGQFWFESDTGKLFVYFTDVNSSQWVQVGGP